MPCRIFRGMWDLSPWPGIKPRPPALGAWGLSHWTTRDVPSQCNTSWCLSCGLVDSLSSPIFMPSSLCCTLGEPICGWAPLPRAHKPNSFSETVDGKSLLGLFLNFQIHHCPMRFSTDLISLHRCLHRCLVNRHGLVFQGDLFLWAQMT